METFAYYFWTFMLGAFLGVVIETLWCMARYKKLESRKGLIFGPFNALYGCATVALSFCINHLTTKEIGNIFIIGVVVASAIEYLCSYYQEKITGTISWNYDNFKFNLNGRINLVYSLFWGFLTLVWHEQFMPMIEEFAYIVNDFPEITMAAFVFMTLNCLISLAACIRRRQRRQNIQAKTLFEKHLDYVYNDDLMEKIYPNSEFVE